MSEALASMRMGDTWRLYVPSALAYGANARMGTSEYGSVPVSSCVVIDLTLVRGWEEAEFRAVLRKGDQSVGEQQQDGDCTHRPPA